MLNRVWTVFACFTTLLIQQATGNRIIGTLERPFVFFHEEKTGGTTLRHGFTEAVKANKHEKFIIPCTHPIPCKFTASSLVQEEWLNLSSCAVAFLGHFRIGQTLSTLLAIDQGLFGPTECKRNWSNLTLDIRGDNSTSDHVHAARNGLSVTGVAADTRLTNVSEIPEISGAKALSLIQNHVDCTIIKREPLHTKWSFFYFFHYNRIYNQQFVEAFDNPQLDLLFHDYAYSKMMIGIREEDRSMKLAQGFLERCTVGTTENYVEFYERLRRMYPQLPRSENLKHLNPSVATNHDVPGDNSVLVARLDPFLVLSKEQRLKLASRCTKDGALYALARDVYQGRGKRYNRNNEVGGNCDLMCWLQNGEYYLPPPNQGGKCQPCIFNDTISLPRGAVSATPL